MSTEATPQTTVRALVFTSPAHDLVAVRGTFSPTTSTLLVGQSEAVLVDAHYADSRMTWGATRCYGVRTVESADGLVVESERSEPGCVTLTDTFPPGPPTGLRAVASAGAINLIWDANAEADLDGYFLLRGPAPGDELIPISTTAMRETAFEDRVPPGMRFVYAVQAVDRSGNLSPISGRIEETAR